ANDMISSGETSLVVGIATTLSVLIIGVVAAVLTSRTISRPVKLLMNRMKAITNGDLRHDPLAVTSRDEIGQLVTATNDMNETMRDLLTQVAEVSKTVSSQSEEMTQSADEVKEGASQVASTIEELAEGSGRHAYDSNELASTMTNVAGEIDHGHVNGGKVEESSSEENTRTLAGSKLIDSSKEQMDKS